MDSRNTKRTKLNRCIGKAANSRGEIAENRVEALLSELDESWPIWVFSGRKATRGEDKSGKDFIFVTDVGKLFIQIKSSIAGVRKFKMMSSPRKMIEPVIVTADIERAEVRSRLIDALYLLRARVFERRGR